MITITNAQQSAATAPHTAGAAAGADNAADPSLQSPIITFKDLLAQLRTLKGGHDNTAKPSDARTEDKGVELESAAGPQPIAVAPESPLSVLALPLAPAGTMAESAGKPADDKQSRARGATAEVLLPSQALGTEKSTTRLDQVPVKGSATEAADSAMGGISLPAANGHAAVDTAQLPVHAAQSQGAVDAATTLAGTLSASATAPHGPAVGNVPQHGPAAPAYSTQIHAEVGSAAWGNELGQQMVLMVGQKQHVAELHLNPPHLGPLDIKITVDSSQTTAVFTSPHGAVRDAISAELPRLREVLADSGITLGNASVTADQPHNGSAYESRHSHAQGGPGTGTPIPGNAEAAAPVRTTHRLGVVDLFA